MSASHCYQSQGLETSGDQVNSYCCIGDDDDGDDE